MLDTKEVKRYARYFLAMKKCDTKAKEMRKKLDEWQPSIIDQMDAAEVDKISLKGGDTLSIQSQIWGKVLVLNENGQADKARVVTALREEGLHELVTEEGFNHMALAGYLRELARSEKPLPKSLRGIIEANPVDKLIVKKLS